MRREPLLLYPDFEKEFLITFDGSPNVIGRYYGKDVWVNICL
jgi:hypothetical protein